MKKTLFAITFLLSTLAATAQVQPLAPTQLSVFKNGTYFIKREAQVTVKDNLFYIPAPQNVLMGTWWLSVSKEAALSSISIKEDTIKVPKKADHLYAYLLSNIGENIILYGNSIFAGETKKLSGKLLDFNPINFTITLQAAGGNIIVTSASDFSSLELPAKSGSVYHVDSTLSTAKVKLSRSAPVITASTISLEKGIQWYPSYLFTPVNEKEARLEMKAVIVNGDMNILNTPVDIIIGNPEMFFGKQLDPMCTGYLNNHLLSGGFDNQVQAMSYSTNATSLWSYGNNGSSSGGTDAVEEPEEKTGEKSEDLYYYRLGNLDLEKNSKLIIPVTAASITYKEVYTADLSETSNESTDPVEVYHNYKISNSTPAPLTTGVVFILNQQKQPFAQSNLNYTPAKGNTEIRLSKAIDVQVKNEEEEIKREKLPAVKKDYTPEKISYKGNVSISNYQEKQITVKINKTVDGTYTLADNEGKTKKLKNLSKKEMGYAEWEVQLKPGATMQLNYQYFSIK